MFVRRLLGTLEAHDFVLWEERFALPSAISEVHCNGGVELKWAEVDNSYKNKRNHYSF